MIQRHVASFFSNKVPIRMIKYGFGAFLTHASTVCTMQRTASFCTRYGIAPRARDHVAAAFIGTPNTVNQRYPTLRHVARKNGCRQTKCIAIGRWSFLGWRENVVVVFVTTLYHSFCVSTRTRTMNVPSTPRHTVVRRAVLG